MGSDIEMAQTSELGNIWDGYWIVKFVLVTFLDIYIYIYFFYILGTYSGVVPGEVLFTEFFVQYWLMVSFMKTGFTSISNSSRKRN